jgi:MFS superfamily sulfate permease-like transporter
MSYSEQLIPMFGLSSLAAAVHPHTTLDKIVFLVENVWRAHRPTALVSFVALAVLVALRAVKKACKGIFFIYRLPEVLVVVVGATRECDEEHRNSQLTNA